MACKRMYYLISLDKRREYYKNYYQQNKDIYKHRYEQNKLQLKEHDDIEHIKCRLWIVILLSFFKIFVYINIYSITLIITEQRTY